MFFKEELNGPLAKQSCYLTRKAESKNKKCTKKQI